MSTKFATTTWTSRYLTCVNAALLAGGLSLGCVADAEIDTEEQVGESADELTGWLWYSKGSTTDYTPTIMGSISDRTCVLRGVQGNLSRGGTKDSPTGDEGRRSLAATIQRLGNYELYGSGGSYTDSSNHHIWYNNPVLAHATCFFTTLNYQTSRASSFTSPWKLADLDPANRRQCFLSAVVGTDDSWDEPTDYAMVSKVTTASSKYSTPGWYLETNVTGAGAAGPEVHATCVDFPEGTVFSTGYLYVEGGAEDTDVITGGPGIKGCGLMEIRGAFNQNSWTDGVVINQPSTIDGQWTITVRNNKAARWACAK
jgi:hypothetical protein